MDNQKYLVIITLIEGQNFTVPSGAPDKIEATVFAEARFGNESVLRSDPIKLTNSNPEFITELAWQLDRKSLHQLRVERKAIKLQVFMQTKERKKPTRLSDTSSNATDDKSDETHKVELIGYTILDLRSAQQIEHPNQFRWCPLLNPKFRKSSYNRPEIQLAITLNRLDEETNRDDSNQFSSICSLPDDGQANESLEFVSTQNESREHNHNSSSNGTSKLYTTCLDVTMNSDSLEKDEIIDNDIIIRSRGGIIYVYDANSQKSSLEDCNEKYRLIIRIPFSTGLDALVGDGQQEGSHYFSINLFGTTFKTLGLDDAKEMVINIMTTHPAALATYFELNSNLDIRLHRATGDMLGLSTIQLNQLCSLDLKCRSIEGIFALQSLNDDGNYPPTAINPSIGVSVVLEKVDSFVSEVPHPIETQEPECPANKQSCDTQGDRMVNSINDTHQITLDESTPHNINHEIFLEDHDPGEDDHHYCFTIDLKKFSYTPSQRLIPMLRELVISYSYYWFGYVDKITTDASIPINATSSIIVSGFCEFNFASTSGPLLTALSEIPLNLEILAVDETRLKDLDNESHERVVATCSINLAEILGLHVDNINQIGIEGISRTSSVPIFALDGQAIGELQIYLCLKDLGKPAKNFSHKASFENLCDNYLGAKGNSITNNDFNQTSEICRLDNLMAETKKNLESWTEDNFNKLADELRRRETERFKRISQRIEAKEAKRDLEFKKKLDDLNNLEKKFLHSLANVDCLEKMLTESIEHLKSKNSNLDDRLNMLELKISKAACNGHATNSTAPATATTSTTTTTNNRLADDHVILSRNEIKTIPYWARNVQISPRRASSSGCNLPVRSSSLVRTQESTVAPKQMVVRRTTGPVPTANVRNVVNSRVRSNSAKISLSRDTLEKLSGSRKERTQPR
uniref:Centrosomal protein n=1 Tax=Aceria tosichella TaxID=561515 RepID=A0A6G1SD35_9ACAR